MKLLKTIGVLVLSALVLTGCPKKAPAKKTTPKKAAAAKTMAKKTAAKSGATSKPTK